MIDGPFKNRIPESVVPVEKVEDLENIAKDIKNLQSEIEDDIEEIGGEDEFEKELDADYLLKERFQIKKEKIAWYGAMIATAIYSGVFGQYALNDFDTQNIQSSLETLKSAESIISITFAVMAIVSFLGLRQTYKRENEILDKPIDQI